MAIASGHARASPPSFGLLLILHVRAEVGFPISAPFLAPGGLPSSFLAHGFLEKPVRGPALVAKLRSLLDEPLS